MLAEKEVKGKKIRLRQIELSDCNENYLKWMNDTEVNRYMETRWAKQDMDSIRAFVQSQRENSHSILFAIIDNKSGMHIGNIKLGPISEHHHHADISYFIGDRSLWGKGLATEAIHLACEYGFDIIHLHRIEAGAYSGAVGSWKALEKNGFIREAVFREQVMAGNRYMDVYRYGLLSSELRDLF